MRELSMDARALLTGWFGFGHKTRVEVGGENAQGVLSQRALASIIELVVNGYATAERIGDDGRMCFSGTEKCEGMQLSSAKMEKFGDWKVVVSNRARAAGIEVKEIGNG